MGLGTFVPASSEPRIHCKGCVPHRGQACLALGMPYCTLGYSIALKRGGPAEGVLWQGKKWSQPGMQGRGDLGNGRANKWSQILPGQEVASGSGPSGLTSSSTQLSPLE